MLAGRGIRRAGALASAGLAAALLASCTDLSNIPKHLQPLSYATKQLIEDKGMEDDAPILVRIFKEDGELEVWKQKRETGRYALLKKYDICKWSGNLGPKVREGDRQAPEGFYTVTPAQMNPKSSYHLSFNIGYPNAYDRALERTGSHLMVHGACSSRGCYSMDDEQIQEIYTLARLSFQGGQRAFQVQAYPFHMTPENMARHRKDPNIDFWRMLKEGHDHFQVTGQPPKVDVCAKRYVFNSLAVEGVTFNPTAECPEMSVPDPIRLAVHDKSEKDAAETQIIVARLEAEEARKARKAAPQSIADPQIMIAGAAVPASQTDSGATFTTASAEPATAAAPVPEAKPATGDGEMASAYVPKQPNVAGKVGGFVKGLIGKVF
ncbi:MAG: murein L,D-transpeptidase [Hyphomicrobiales bacterium]|nr:murein L,D-transpeptidase [Hyphomicrobiales bacterium]